MNILIHVLLFYIILLFSFSIVSDKHFSHVAHAADSVGCIERMLQNLTIRSSDCNNLDISTADDPCSSIIAWIELTRIPLNATRQSLQSENITGVLNNLNTTESMLEELRENRGDITFGNVSLQFVPLTHPCYVAGDVEVPMTYLTKSQESLQSGNMAEAINNLNEMDRSLEVLKSLLESQMRVEELESTEAE